MVWKPWNQKSDEGKNFNDWSWHSRWKDLSCLNNCILILRLHSHDIIQHHFLCTLLETKLLSCSLGICFPYMFSQMQIMHYMYMAGLVRTPAYNIRVAQSPSGLIWYICDARIHVHVTISSFQETSLSSSTQKSYVQSIDISRYQIVSSIYIVIT